MAETILIWWVLPTLVTLLFLCRISKFLNDPVEEWEKDDIASYFILSIVYPAVYIALVLGVIDLIRKNLTKKVW